MGCYLVDVMELEGEHIPKYIYLKTMVSCLEEVAGENAADHW